MNISKLREEKPMLYWSLPNGDNYKTKFKKALANENYILTKKVDGALYRYSKSCNDAILQSRTISRSTGVLVEKQDNVPAIMEALNVLPKDTILMGEICFKDPNLTSKDVISIMGCLPAKAIQRQKETPVSYYIFDVLAYNGVETHTLPYAKRMQVLKKIESSYDFSDNIIFAQPTTENIEETISQWLAQGFEGAILMHKDKPYLFDKRPAWNSIKVKQELAETLDLVIMEFSPPIKEYTGKYPQGWNYWENVKTGELEEGKLYSNGGYLPISEHYFYGRIGGFKLGAYQGDNLIPVCKVANLTNELREKVTNNPHDYIKKVVRVQAMSVDLQSRSLRHPKLIDFHPDKNDKECLYSDIFQEG